MALFNILVDIAARTANFESGIQNVERRLESFGLNVKRIFEGVTVAAIAELTRRVIEAGAELHDAAEKAAVNGKVFSELAYASKVAGVGVQQLSDLFVKMNKSLSEASTSGKDQNEALHALGLTYRELQSLKPEEQFEVIADRISKLGSAGDKARVEMALFGRSGADLDQLFAKGAEGIRKAREEAERLGQSFTDEQLQNLDDAKKAIDRMEASASGLATTLAAKAAPAVALFFDQIAAAVSGDQILHLQNRIREIQSALDYFNKFPDVKVFQGFQSKGDALRALEAAETQLSILRSSVSTRNLESPGTAALLAQGGKPPGYRPDLEEVVASVGKLSGRSGINPILDDWDKQTRRTLETASAQFDDTEAKLRGLLQDNVITAEEFNRRLDEAKQKYNNAIDLSPVLISARKQVDVFLTQAQERVKAFREVFESSMNSAFHQGGNFAKNFLRTLLQTLSDRAIFTAIEKIGTALENALTSRAGGGALGGLLGGIFGIGAGGGADSLEPVTPTVSKLPAFAMGGSFMVGGSGGVDSQLVAFRASPGESVSVGGGGGLIVAPTYNIDARGATQDLIAQLPAVMKANNEALKSDILDTLSRQRRHG